MSVKIGMSLAHFKRQSQVQRFEGRHDSLSTSFKQRLSFERMGLKSLNNLIHLYVLKRLHGRAGA